MLEPHTWTSYPGPHAHPLTLHVSVPVVSLLIVQAAVPILLTCLLAVTQPILPGMGLCLTEHLFHSSASSQHWRYLFWYLSPVHKGDLITKHQQEEGIKTSYDEHSYELWLAGCPNVYPQRESSLHICAGPGSSSMPAMPTKGYHNQILCGHRSSTILFETILIPDYTTLVSLSQHRYSIKLFNRF